MPSASEESDTPKLAVNAGVGPEANASASASRTRSRALAASAADKCGKTP